MVNSKNPMLLFGTHVVEQSKVPFSDAQKKFFELLSIVQLSIALFDSWLVPLINYAIGLSTLKILPVSKSWLDFLPPPYVENIGSVKVL